MSTPQIPPRPTRSQQASEQAPAAATAAAAAAAASQLPTVPPRPANKLAEQAEALRSANNYPRSPLHDTAWHPHNTDGASDLHRMASLNASRTSVDLSGRPPSVNMPSIGQEGLEYEASTPPPPSDEAIAPGDASPVASPTHTRKVSHDLPLHAPRPSLSSSDAKQRVAAVVRTDSSAVAAPAASPSLRSKPSFNRPPSSASSHERPGSSYDEHGIPHFGQTVPLGAQYGDVQAPSPKPQHSQPNTPLTPGFDQRPGSSRHHQRSKSGRNSFQAPPGSYGLHGHGVHENVDNFEKAWLQKHPEVLREELAAHSPAILDRRTYTLTPEQLNKIVKANMQQGFGTSGHVSMPDEQIGYLASEAYASQTATPRPPTSEIHRPPSLHFDEPEHKESKHIGRGQASEQEHVDLGPRGGNTEAEGGWHNESGYGVPILASDEVDPTNRYMHPAVPPISDSRRGSYVSQDDGSNSRPSSRIGSGMQSPHGLHKTVSRSEYEYRPLEDVREYEPLFPDDEDEKLAAGKKPGSVADRFKQRPDLMKQRFPSQDIWEDSPASVNLETEVETPEPERQHPATSVFETPEKEAARKGEVSEAEKAKLLPRDVRLAQSAFQPHIKQEMRPTLAQQRFPSRDIWEDSPDSSYMTTTVDENDEQDEEEDEATKAGAVVHTTSNLSRKGATAGAPVVKPATSNTISTPAIPPRPAQGKTLPTVPARPARRPSPSPARAETAAGAQDSATERGEKPTIPARPAKTVAAAAATAIVADAAASDRKLQPDLSAKAKPQVPSRPAGSKIAALQAGFMSDLNKKLGLGPQAVPPKAEPKDEAQLEEDKKPLEDARKGRARGPARRRPAASPSAGATTTSSADTAAPRRFVATPVMNLWDISPEGVLNSTHADSWSQKLSSSKPAPISQDVPPAVGFNAQGEAVHVPTVTADAVKATSQVESAPALQAEAEVSGEPADVGHGAAAATSSVTAERQELKTGVKDDLGHELRHTTSAGSQTGEMNIVMDKGGESPTQLKGFKNGSAHEEGIAFVKDE